MSKYDDLPREQLIELLKKRDRTKKLGLVWERDEIEADNAVDANFVAATIMPDLSDRPAPWRNMVIEGGADQVHLHRPRGCPALC